MVVQKTKIGVDIMISEYDILDETDNLSMVPLVSSVLNIKSKDIEYAIKEYIVAVVSEDIDFMVSYKYPLFTLEEAESFISLSAREHGKLKDDWVRGIPPYVYFSEQTHDSIN